MHGEKMQHRVEEAVLDSYESMYRLAMTYVRNEEDALDIVQDSVYKAIRNARQIKNERYIQTWICRIVINTAMDFLRKNQRELPVEDFYDVYETGQEDIYQDTDTEKVLDILSDRERTVVILRFLRIRSLKKLQLS